MEIFAGILRIINLKLVGFLLFAIFSIPNIAYGSEHFLFDAEQNKILYMDAENLNFTEEMDMEKVPDLLMKTADSDKYLAIYGPEKTAEKKESGSFFAGLFKTAAADKKQSIAGQLILFNVQTGRTEDLVDVGFAPFNWEYSEDRQHFFITYRVSDEKNSRFELLHYNITEMTCEKIELPAMTKSVNQIVINKELNRLYLLLDNEDRRSRKKERTSGEPQILTVNTKDFKVEKSTPLKNAPLRLRLLGGKRGVLICQDWKVDAYYSNGAFHHYINLGEGSISYLDLHAQECLEEYKVGEEEIYYQWFDEEEIYITYYQTQESYLKKNHNFLKITRDGVEKTELTEEPLDFAYYPEDDELYVLHKDTLCTIDYQTNQVSAYDTGNNTYKKTPYSFHRFPQSNLAVIYSLRDGKVKYYDLEKNKVIRKVLSGRTWGKVGYLFKTIFTRKTEAVTMISTNSEQSKFYVYNRMSNDITVYDRGFQSEKYIITPEPALGLYQITEPTMKTLVFTGKSIYELTDDQGLNLIHGFDEKTSNIMILGEKNRVILVSETELLVLNPVTLKKENCIKFFVGRNEKYTKLKSGDQRFYFIETL